MQLLRKALVGPCLLKGFSLLPPVTWYSLHLLLPWIMIKHREDNWLHLGASPAPESPKFLCSSSTLMSQLRQTNM